ncbi:hypothetical protein NL533_31190, partial [Klebsiella pneumoniae]|nr:hypothetical protein [Klebsiella pneumoniae]
MNSTAAVNHLSNGTTGNKPLDRAIEKADVLIEALEWIRKFRGKVVVINVGGSVMEDDNALRHLLLDIV